MNQIQTTVDFLSDKGVLSNHDSIPAALVKGYLIEFAQLHLKAQQEAIIKDGQITIRKMGITPYSTSARDFSSSDLKNAYSARINEESITSAYNLNDIK